MPARRQETTWQAAHYYAEVKSRRLDSLQPGSHDPRASAPHAPRPQARMMFGQVKVSRRAAGPGWNYVT